MHGTTPTGREKSGIPIPIHSLLSFLSSTLSSPLLMYHIFSLLLFHLFSPLFSSPPPSLLLFTLPSFLSSLLSFPRLSFQVVTLLLHHGADANSRDNWSYTPLHEAAIKGKIDVCIGIHSHTQTHARTHTHTHSHLHTHTHSSTLICLYAFIN